ncbi:hypothetical protein [Bradyrhizobium jicamae]|nr:hypothetical protein [Bradyrhizobium jicamae]
MKAATVQDSLGQSTMDKFELNHAVSLFTQQTTTINSLWTVYVAATFAAAGYGFSVSPLSPIIAGAVTLGFLVFTFGNWKLLKQGLQINRQLQKDITDFIQSAAESNPFKLSIKKLVSTANPPWISLVIHLWIDFCVVAALWSRVKWPA